MIDQSKLKVIVVNDFDQFRLLYSDKDITLQNYKVIIPCLVSDVPEILNKFSDINKISIYESDGTTLLLQSQKFTTYSDASIITSGVYKDMNNQPIQAIMIVLKSMDIENSVRRIEEEVFPVVDFDGMSLDEYKEYYVKLFGDTCQKNIFDGVDVELSDGGVKHFAATLEDQNNLLVQFNSAMMNKRRTDLAYPYHADGEQYQMYSFDDICKIYSSVQSHILKETSYCNALNTYVRGLENKSDISSVVYGQEIPDENINEIMNETYKNGMELIQSLTK